MPIFEYSCLACGFRFEKLEKSGTAVQQVECIQCGSTKVRKELSGFSTGCGSSSTGASFGGG